MEDWYKKGQWRDSKWRVQHMSDYIRMVSLYKAGEMYLDLDIVTIKSYDGPWFRIFVVMETASNNLVTNAVLHLERNNQLIESIFKIMIQKCDSDDYTFNGPGCVSEA